MAVRIKVMAGTPPSRGHGPVNLALVLDTSGSMEGEAIASTRAAAQALIDRMADGDRVSIVVFHSIGEVLVKSTRLDGKSRAQIAAKLGKLEARGTTDLASGWGLGLAELSAGRTEKTLNRLVLVTDGIPNDVSMIPSLVAQTRSHQVPITTLCLDVECEATLLGDIAVQTGGKYKYL
jgi:Ca-activated chloride channel family protein